jgi:hypothetical protein
MDAVTDIRKKYILNLGVLKPGDIILEHGYKAHSHVIMAVTQSHYSHAMLFEGSTIIEATLAGGVFSKVPNRFAVVSPEDIKVLRLRNEISSEKINVITATSRNLTGSSYNKSQAFMSGGKKKPTKKTASGQFCSRLVAQCYNSVGIKLVDNINFCSPADLERSPLLIEVDDAVIEASEEQLSHALAPSPHEAHLKGATQWIKAAKKILKKSDIEVETINDVLTATIKLKNTKVDKLILKAIKESGYYDFYLIDKQANPHRYDIDLFSEEIGTNLDKINSEIAKESSILKTHSTNLINSRDYYNYYPSCLMQAEVNLYSNILGITNERLKIIIAYCEKRELIPELLNEAKRMNNYIDNIL